MSGGAPLFASAPATAVAPPSRGLVMPHGMYMYGVARTSARAPIPASSAIVGAADGAGAAPLSRSPGIAVRYVRGAAQPLLDHSSTLPHAIVAATGSIAAPIRPMPPLNSTGAPPPPACCQQHSCLSPLLPLRPPPPSRRLAQHHCHPQLPDFPCQPAANNTGACRHCRHRRRHSAAPSSLCYPRRRRCGLPGGSRCPGAQDTHTGGT